MSDVLWKLLLIVVVIAVWWFVMLFIDSMHSGRPMWTIAKELFKSSKK